jgi:hypothetical protein
VNEVCPSCGSFTDYLGEVTGWCHECESITGIVDAKAHRRTLDGRRGKCRKCATAQRLAWRAANRERDNENWRRAYARKVARLEEAS